MYYVASLKGSFHLWKFTIHNIKVHCNFSIYETSFFSMLRHRSNTFLKLNKLSMSFWSTKTIGILVFGWSKDKDLECIPPISSSVLPPVPPLPFTNKSTPARALYRPPPPPLLVLLALVFVFLTLGKHSSTSALPTPQRRAGRNAIGRGA